jgi:hypothetical protein
LPHFVQPGQYFECNRIWKKGDAAEFDFDLSIRYVAGDREASGKVSLYRGPLLLAYDQSQNAFDEAGMPLLDLSRLAEARLCTSSLSADGNPNFPWLQVDFPTVFAAQTGSKAKGANPILGFLRLCDFASAGANGTRYRSWLSATNPPPPPPILRTPSDGEVIGSGKTVFRWTTRTNATLTDYLLTLAKSPEFSTSFLDFKGLTQPRFELGEQFKNQFIAGQRYYWRVKARGPRGETWSVEPNSVFTFEPGPFGGTEEPSSAAYPNALIVGALLRGDVVPQRGILKRATSFAAVRGPGGLAVRLNGKDQILVYALPQDFGEDYSVAVRFRLASLPKGRIGQIFSGWAAPMDDPLRITVEDEKLFARIEAKQNYSTKGLRIESGIWHHVGAIKSGSSLKLYLDGVLQETVPVPLIVSTNARVCALGGNPNFPGNEFLAVDLADFVLFLKPLEDAEVRGLAEVSQ